MYSFTSTKAVSVWFGKYHIYVDWKKFLEKEFEDIKRGNQKQ
jgi:hypothetical protein